MDLNAPISASLGLLISRVFVTTKLPLRVKLISEPDVEFKDNYVPIGDNTSAVTSDWYTTI